MPREGYPRSEQIQDGEAPTRLGVYVSLVLHRRGDWTSAAPAGTQSRSPDAWLRVADERESSGLRVELRKHLDALGMVYEHDGIAWTYVRPLPEDELTQDQQDLRNLLTAPAEQVCHTTRIIDFIGTTVEVLYQTARSQPLSEENHTGRPELYVGSRHGAIRVVDCVEAPDLSSQLHMAELHTHSTVLGGVAKKMLGHTTDPTKSQRDAIGELTGALEMGAGLYVGVNRDGGFTELSIHHATADLTIWLRWLPTARAPDGARGTWRCEYGLPSTGGTLLPGAPLGSTAQCIRALIAMGAFSPDVADKLRAALCQ